MTAAPEEMPERLDVRAVAVVVAQQLFCRFLA
jgi:hypothetical protein